MNNENNKSPSWIELYCMAMQFLCLIIVFTGLIGILFRFGNIISLFR